jgi:F-type H+-transporting ATPase subunit epsilon
VTTLKVEITTPEAALFNGEANALVARSRDGDFTVLAQHAPFVGALVPGVVRVESTEGDAAFLVHGGFFQVDSAGEGVTLATVLVGVAEPLSSIDVPRAQRAKEAAEAIINGRSDDVDDVAMSEAHDALARAELRLSVTN